MHTLRLCDTVLRAHLHPATPKPSKLPNCSSPFTRFHKKSMNSCWRSHFRLSRHAGQWLEYLDIDKESSRHFPQSSDLQHVLRLTEDTVDHWEKAVNLMQIQQDIDPLDKSVVVTSLKEEKCTSTSFENDAIHVSCTHAPLFSTVKFALLFGLLTFHGSQQAVANSEFSPIDFIGDLGDTSTGFASAFLLIFFSELGDKTFFIAALLASRNSGNVIFIGTFGALAAMTIISVVLGRTFHYIDDILPFRFGDTDLPIDDIAAVFLLVYFGVSTLLEAASSDSLKTAEEQKQAELAVTELSGNSAGSLAAANTVISTFILVFVAEWGDKSFFSTIALAAASSPLGVIVGALAGHATATLLAVLGGSLLGTFFSEKVISYVGGALFLVFAMVTLIEIVS